MMEERDWLQTEARKLVIGEPTINEDLIDAAFSLICPEWDYSMAEGKGILLVHCQTLLVGLKQL